jgi:hypothetical protein
MGHRKQMTDKERLKFDLENYAKRLEANKGSNYEYWNDKTEQLLLNGYSLYQFTENSSIQWGVRIKQESTSSINMAKKAVEELKATSNYARIVCGYNKNKQRIKMFSVIYKSKLKN